MAKLAFAVKSSLLREVSKPRHKPAKLVLDSLNKREVQKFNNYHLARKILYIENN